MLSNHPVVGTSPPGPGVTGQPDTGDGVLGEGETGVHGEAGANGLGVLGENTGGGYGVKGSTNSPYAPGGSTTGPYFPGSGGTSGVWGDNAGTGIGIKGTSTGGEAVFRAALLSTLVALTGCPQTSGNVTITDRFNAAQVPALSQASVTATCNPGEFVVGGGFAVAPTPAYQGTIGVIYPLDQYFVFASYPSSPTSWTVSVLNRASGDSQGDILAVSHAQCAAGLSSGVSVASASGLIGVSAPLVMASCTQGSATGGGFQVTPIQLLNDVATIDTNAGTGTAGTLNAWSVHALAARNSTLDFSQAQISSYAVCTTALTAQQGMFQTVSALAGLSNMATEGQGSGTCGQGQLLAGAGFQLTTPPFEGFPITSFFTNGSAWSMTMFSLPQADFEGNAGNSGGSINLFPVCAS